jgi:hypothetical protein
MMLYVVRHAIAEDAGDDDDAPPAGRRKSDRAGCASWPGARRPATSPCAVDRTPGRCGPAGPEPRELDALVPTWRPPTP